MSMDPQLAVGAGLAAMGVLGPGIGVGLIGAKALESMSRQPELSGKLFINGIIFAVLVEIMGLIAAVIAMKFAGFINI